MTSVRSQRDVEIHTLHMRTVMSRRPAPAAEIDVACMFVQGALEVLVKMIENGMANYKMKASEPFHTEVLEHVADLQRKDPNVRAALAEVGGLEELLGLIEAGSEIKSSGTPREKQLVPVQASSCKSHECRK